MSSALVQREYWFGLQWVNAGGAMRQAQTPRMRQSYWACLMGGGGDLQEQTGKPIERQTARPIETRMERQAEEPVRGEAEGEVARQTAERTAGRAVEQTTGQTVGQRAGQTMGWVPSTWLTTRRTRSVMRLAQNGPSRARLTRAHAYSAAACMAVHYPQEAVFLLWTVAPGRLWFLVLEHGLVMEGSDCLLAQVGQVQTLRQAMQARYPSIRELRQPDDLWVCLEQGKRPQCRMQRQPVRRVGWHEKIPLRPVILAVLVMATLGGVLSVDLLPGRLAANASDWEQGAAQEEPSLTSIQSVLGLIEELPAQGADWQLQQVDCRRQAVLWECQAHYGFEDVQSFSAAMHSQNRDPNVLELTGLGQGDLHIRRGYQALIPHSLETQDQEQMPTAASSRLHAGLAALRPAFMRLSLSPAQWVESADDSEQTGAGVWRRSWLSQSPLRSVYLLAAQLPDLQWERLSLSLNPQSYPSLLGSAFIVELEGYVYESAERVLGDQDLADYMQTFEHSVWSDADV